MADEEKKVAKTGAVTHRATERGYSIVNGAGELVEAGDIVPPGNPISDAWMEKVSGKEDKVQRAVDDAMAFPPPNPDLSQLSKQALEAMATERNISVRGLSKDDLITAIKAATVAEL